MGYSSENVILRCLSSHAPFFKISDFTSTTILDLHIYVCDVKPLCKRDFCVKKCISIFNLKIKGKNAAKGQNFRVPLCPKYYFLGETILAAQFDHKSKWNTKEWYNFMDPPIRPVWILQKVALKWCT